MSGRSSPDGTNNHSIFFSYSRRDIGIAKLLIKEIERQEANVQVFIDERGIEGGDPIKETIRKKIQDCDEMLVLLTAFSVKSTWVTIEVSAAWTLEKTIVAIVYEVTPRDMLPIIADMEAVELEDFDKYLAQLAKRAKGKQR